MACHLVRVHHDVDRGDHVLEVRGVEVLWKKRACAVRAGASKFTELDRARIGMTRCCDRAFVMVALWPTSESTSMEPELGVGLDSSIIMLSRREHVRMHIGECYV